MKMENLMSQLTLLFLLKEVSMMKIKNHRETQIEIKKKVIVIIIKRFYIQIWMEKEVRIINQLVVLKDFKKLRRKTVVITGKSLIMKY